MAGILDSLFGDLQGTSAGGLLGLLGGGNIGTATRRLRTPEEEQQAALKGDYLGVTPQVPQAFGGNFSLPSQVPSGFPATAPPQDYVGTPGALDPKWQALLAGNTDPYQPNAQLPPTATPTVGAQNGPGVTLPQLSDGGFGRDTGPQNPLMGLLGGIGNLFGPSAAQAAPAPGTAQQPNLPAPAAASPGLFGRLSAGANSLEGNNPFSALINGLQGLATGQRNDVHGVALQTQAATIAGFKQALMANGMPEAQAASLAQASLNSEVAKTLAPLLYSKPTFTQIGEDAFGNKQYGFVQPDKMKVTPADAAAGGTAGGTSGFLAPGVRQIDSSLAGQDYLKQFSPEVQAAVKDYVEGRSMPTGNPRKGFTQTVKMIAQKYGNDIGMPADDIAFATRKKTAGNFAPGGTSANNVKSLETVGGHIDKMMTAFDQLGNTWQPEFNSVKNWMAQRLGSGGVNAYETAANGVANELGTVFRSSGMSDAEVKSWRDRIAAANSPEQFQSSMRMLLDMLKTRKEALQEQYSNPVTGLGRPLPKETFQKLDAAIAKIESKFAPGGGEQGTASQQPMRPIDKAAIDWANANPKDPRAAAIKQRLGVQ